MAKIMAVNAGSSSLKFKLYEMPREKVICSGNIERIGHDDAIFGLKDEKGAQKKIIAVPDHATAVAMLVDSLLANGIIRSLAEIKAAGHRIVQGGSYFHHSVLFDEDTEKKIESLIPLAPLHNAAHLIGFRAFKKILPAIMEVAIFDTAFHQTMAPEDSLFPIPYEYTVKYRCRRYGAHGTSHHYLALEGRKFLPGIAHPRIISCHIGSGVSITAIKDGRCVATSMGLTPLGGVMMGTRTGDLDPSVMNYLCAQTGKTVEEMYQLFNKGSGLLGVSGFSDDSRDIETAWEKGDERAMLAYRLFVRRIVDYIGRYHVRLGGVDLIIFSAGIGEHSPLLRQLVCHELKAALGVRIMKRKNESYHGEAMLISAPMSKVKVAVIPTDEEVMIARDTYAFYKKQRKADAAQ